MNYSQMRFPNFRKKAVTLSYDDGVKFDKRLMEIMDKYGLKGTFNLNGGLFVEEEDARKMPRAQTLALFQNCKHEIAVHGYKHPSLAELDRDMIVYDIIKDREALEELFGRVIKGMAYPNGSVDDKTVEALRMCGIEYARTVVSTEKFDIPTDWLRLPATCHHNNPRLMELAKAFVEAGPARHFWYDTPMLFYLWGHSYEFNDRDNWNVIEEFAEYIGGRVEIWYATNGEIYDYVKAFDRLRFSVAGTFVQNPSALDVYLCYKGKNILVPAGQTVDLRG